MPSWPRPGRSRSSCAIRSCRPSRTALSGRDVIGHGVVFALCREQQRIFMNGAWPDLSRAAGSSKYR
jgi:hypothetical protein